MTILEAIERRHTVRKFTGQPIPAKTAALLRERLAEHNRAHGLTMRLVTGNQDAFGPLIKLILAKGAENYIVLAGPDSPALRENLGYCGADVMLYAQTLGLNSWWVGGTYSRKGVQAAAEIGEDETVLGVIAVGFGATQGKPHKSKSPEEVSHFAGEMPAWFRNGVRAALLAPTALNKQAFFLDGTAKGVRIDCDNGIFTDVDRGIVKYHFEIGAGAENINWI